MSIDAQSTIRTLFEKRGWNIFAFQQQAWDAYLNGESGLIHSPTGTGKTLAAWLGPLMEDLQDGAVSSSSTPLQVLWITPLRALAADTEASLQEVVDDLGLAWTVERRTGDTSAAQRARQKKKLPSALVTTPESLSLLLSYKDIATRLRDVKCVVVDEWHELLGSKRGVQLELCLASLRAINPTLRTWGLSATIGNVDEALHVLLGNPDKGTLIKAEQDKQIHVRSLVPDSVENFPWGGHLGIRLLPEVIKVIEQANSTLLFANTRSQAELWYESILKARPDWLETLAIHHGSLNREIRDRVEDGLRDGSVRCTVCTSSLDLGVDFSPVDQVIQVGSPKGVARLLQRAGRCGHRPGIDSAIICVPTHAFELVEIAAARQAKQQGRIEQRKPLRKCLDVLAQHCVTLALGSGFVPAELRSEIETCYAFADITDAEWQWVMDFITRGGDALQHYPQYQKVVCNDGVYRVEDNRIARQHRMSIGTITSDSAMQVRYMKGGRIGTIEESFIAKLNPGDAFLFNGKVLSLVQVKDMTAYVKQAKTKTRIVPRWQGGRMPLTNELADSVREMLDPRIDSGDIDELDKISELLFIQQQWSCLPAPDQLLVESIRSREGQHLFIYPFAGRLVHEGLAALTAWRLSQLAPATFTTSANDYGFELLTRKQFTLDIDQLKSLLSPEHLPRDLLQGINESELARRQFRDIARVAGLVFQGYPGSGKTTRQIQASSGLLYDVLKKYDAGNLLLAQSLTEVLEHQIEHLRLQQCLQRIAGQEIMLREPARLTPLAFPLWAERLRGQIISSEKWQDRVQRMVTQLERVAGKHVQKEEQQAVATEPLC